MRAGWDYLILTASNERQASAYEAQLAVRRETGRLTRVAKTLVVADLEGKRIGSGGSTVECLRAVVTHEASACESAEAVLRRLRILIVHAGGDSRRLPAYGPCGKIFLPVPGDSEGALNLTLFDRVAPIFLGLPEGAPGAGQVVVTAGDALISLDAASVRFDGSGLTAVGCEALPEEAARHGVFCAGDDGVIRVYLQKPSLEEQRIHGAVNRYGKAMLDAGVMSFDGTAAAALLAAFPAQAPLLEWGVDLYREICCALGTEATVEHFVGAAKGSGSLWPEGALRDLFPKLREIPFRLQSLPQCSFLHFGSTRQLIESGVALGTQDRDLAAGVTCLSLGNEVRAGGWIAGAESWVEGCRISAGLSLGGRNVVVGPDVDEDLTLPRGACLDVLAGDGEWFIRCYGVDDDFKKPAARGGWFMGRPILEWVAAAGLTASDVWDADEPERSLWNARVFPVEKTQNYRKWLWLFDVDLATEEQRREFREVRRTSAEETALTADQAAFHRRRAEIRAAQVGASLSQVFRPASSFSAEDLAFALRHSREPAQLVADVLALGRSAAEAEHWGTLESLSACRVLHALGSALAMVPGELVRCEETPESLRAEAFAHLHRTILRSSLSAGQRPKNRLRPDETIWGRGPARIELGGGWTDTPPYTLEHGGDVANVAVNLNGQPPIHCYCRVIDEPVIRLNSIDGGLRLEVRDEAELVDYRRPGDRFALSKAAIAISGFSHEAADWPAEYTLRDMLREFGGGIELTTLVGIPKGSGLGTSSILGAVILAVLNRLTGKPLETRALFHDVLRLEQALTTGGGWQDQAGGGVGGAKVTSTRPGMIPTPRIHYVPSDLINPRVNGGSTLLYYTGMTRIAKNILEQVVGGYLDRNGAILAALEEEHEVAQAIVDALSRKDAAAFGRYVNAAWELQKRLCGTVTNEEIERLLERVRPYVHGMRISGAGSGGFLLMICKSGSDAVRVRELLEKEPLNERSRFFDFDVNEAGLEVTTC